MPERIAIVGNGAVGLALAYRLCRAARPPEILVYGPRDIARTYAGSNAAPAMINVFGEVTAGIEASWAAQHKLAIGEAAMALWPQLVAAVNAELTARGEAPVGLFHGTYVLARPDRPDEAANLGAIRTALAERNRRYEELDLDRCATSAIVQPRRFAGGIYIPDEMSVDALRLLHGLRACLAARPNVSLRHCLVRDIDPDRLTLRDDAGGSERADAIVLANGIEFNELAESMGLTNLPYLLPVYGVGMTISASTDRPVTIRTPVYGASCGDYAVHFPDHIYVGASAIANTGRVEITTHLRRSLDFFDPDANLNGICLRGGTRALPQDVYPLIGKLREGLWTATGFFKSGVTLAPYVADLLGRELLGEAQSHCNRFTPYRRIGEPPPPVGELADTIWGEIEESATSAGSRAQLARYGWIARRLVRWEVGRLVRRFEDGVYYNSDIVQACAYDPALLAKLNRYRPQSAA